MLPTGLGYGFDYGVAEFSSFALFLDGGTQGRGAEGGGRIACVPAVDQRTVASP